MTKPSAIVFDLGKVLLDFDYSIAAHKFASHGKISASEIRHFIDHSPLLFRYETGLMTREEFFREISAASGFSGDIHQFTGYFSDIFAPIEPMIRLQAALRREGMPTYIFSNTNEMAVKHIRHTFPFFANFDGYIFSYEHGAMKPDAKLYEVVERISGRRKADILYLDDRPENVQAGAARGWQVIHHHSPEQTRTEIQKLGLLRQAR
jgi:HAD superfamily hydrolase (TIGR01509 family)